VNHFMKRALPIAATFAIAACSSNAGSLPSTGAVGTYAPAAGRLTAGSLDFKLSDYHHACNGSRINQMQCDLLVGPQIDPAISGITQPELLAAYGLKPTGGKGTIIALVDAFDNPNAASDLAAYRSYFGIPKANFKKYNQTGQQSNYPSPNADWGGEEDLDIEMVSVSCPNCTIYLVEATTNNSNDLSAAEVEAAKLGATVISNSFSGSGSTASAFGQKGISYFASAGDAGYGIGYPASYANVVSVGGTVLLSGAKGKRGYTEIIWPDSGAGCSHEAKPSWQKDKGCSNRTANDISAVAANVAMYDTYPSGGWGTVAGTSISSPLTAGIMAEAGKAKIQNGGEVFWGKAAQKNLYPVTQGTDGSCGGSYLCTAGTKQFGNYSGPGGWGTPHGDKAFKLKP
jgi:subtilase family serine protease